MKLKKIFISAASAAIFSGLCIAGVSAEETAESYEITNETEPSAEEVPAYSGWVTDENGKTYYYDENGKKLTGLCEIDGDTYLFAPNGAMKNGWFTVDGIRMFFDLETGKKQTGWISYMGETF